MKYKQVGYKYSANRTVARRPTRRPSYGGTVIRRPKSGPGILSRLKTRFAFSNTRTKTKKKAQDEWDVDGNGMSYHSKKITYKPSKDYRILKRIGNMASYANIGASGATSTEGIQEGAVIQSISTAEIAALYSAMNDGAAVAGDRSTKFALTKFVYEVELSNVGPSDCEIELYWLIDKNSSISANGGPTVEWDQGLGDEQGTGGVGTHQNVWQQPTQVKRFNLLWWTRKIKKSLKSGEKIKLTLTHNINRVIDFEHIQRFVSIRGITSQLYLIQRGTIADGGDATGLQTTGVVTGRQTISRTKVVWLRKYYMTGTKVSSKAKRTTFSGSLPTNLTKLWEQYDGIKPLDTEDPLNYA